MPVLPSKRTLDLQSHSAMMPSRFITALWLTGSSAILSLLLGEVAARWLLPVPFRVITDESNPRIGKAFRSLHQPDPELGWVLAPGPIQFHHRLADQQGVVQYDVVYSIENGQRKASDREQSGDGVIAAGCSFTFGHALNDQDTWPWLLQEKLPGYHVVNTWAGLSYGGSNVCFRRACAGKLIQSPSDATEARQA